MAQMYKVFINESSLELVDTHYPERHTDVFRSNDQLKNILTEISIDSQVQQRVISCKDPAEVWKILQGFYQVIEAGGGLVKNSEGEILLIFRLGKWDLPKGKIEDGESAEDGAMREVMEECGLEKLEIIRKLPETYHTYQLKGKSIFKQTYWFEMHTDDVPDLIPQTEESIEKAEWVHPEKIKAYTANTYASIKWLLNQVV